jgi:hypothetical protein
LQWRSTRTAPGLSRTPSCASSWARSPPSPYTYVDDVQIVNYASGSELFIEVNDDIIRVEEGGRAEVTARHKKGMKRNDEGM